MITERDKQKMQGATVLLSLSGGKDSTACGLLLKEAGVKFTPVFMDTGFEHPWLYQYIRNTLEPLFGPVVRLSSEKDPDGMIGLIKRKGIFPSRKIRYCTEQLKINPYKKHLKTIEGDVVSVVGLRRQESAARSNVRRWDYSDGLGVDVFAPLAEFTFEDVIELHKKHNLAPCRLYLEGAERVGCFPCIYSRKSEVKMLDKLWPERVDQIESLEREIGGTFFGPRSAANEKSDIRTVVEWSKTERGGKQFALFDETSRNGCARWGFCENA
jgi:3'-phosphoadenosine 5'-phosphosulfate sulfotransferase (PAPS reductase)/FAD synthetase